MMKKLLTGVSIAFTGLIAQPASVFAANINTGLDEAMREAAAYALDQFRNEVGLTVDLHRTFLLSALADTSELKTEQGMVVSLKNANFDKNKAIKTSWLAPLYGRYKKAAEGDQAEARQLVERLKLLKVMVEAKAPSYSIDLNSGMPINSSIEDYYAIRTGDIKTASDLSSYVGKSMSADVYRSPSEFMKAFVIAINDLPNEVIESVDSNIINARRIIGESGLKYSSSGANGVVWSVGDDKYAESDRGSIIYKYGSVYYGDGYVGGAEKRVTIVSDK